MKGAPDEGGGGRAGDETVHVGKEVGGEWKSFLAGIICGEANLGPFLELKGKWQK